jgi:exodeoxyribonuclease VII large subunit
MKTMNTLDTQEILTVSQLTQAIKNILETEYRWVRICGEISNLKTPFSGHSYFTLKDAGAQIRAVLFKQQKKFLDLALQDGQQVILFGRISVYEPRGEYQLVVDSVQLYGVGRLLQEFESQKRKLADKGYFAAELKKPLPAFPTKIVVISSPTGAAIQDFLKIVRIRKSPVHIQILPVKVQGRDAAAEIARAIEIAQDLAGVDIVVLCRGGGSIEDLWAFNEEIVADAIHRSVIPVVTGIGHEVDYTIADFCADFRCPTPTGAAEKLVPDTAILRRHLQSLRTSLQLRAKRKIAFLDQQVHHHAKMLGDMENVFKNIDFRLQLSKSYLVQAISGNLLAKEQRLQTLVRRLHREIPSARIALQEQHIHFLVAQLNNHIQRTLEKKQAALAEQATLLNGMSPLATLARGYAIARTKNPEDGSYRVLRRARDAAVGDQLQVLLHEGQLQCLVTASEDRA